MIATAQQSAVELLGGSAFPKVESPSLRLEKFVRLGDNTKKQEIEAVVACHTQHAKRVQALPQPPGAVSFHATLGGRLIVNQAGGVLENAGLCLHRHFGDPYLPGSAVKGLARHAAWCEWHEAEEPAKRAIAEKLVRVFGYPTGDKTGKEDGRVGLDNYIKANVPELAESRAGGVAFLAGLPVGKPALVVEIVNCHHPKYYAGKQEYATDDESPNPQFFPAVEAGGAWRFTLVPLRRLGPDAAALLAQASAWLVQALTIHGAGAKTAAGYGWFIYDAKAEARRKQEEADAKREHDLRKEVNVWVSQFVERLDALDTSALVAALHDAEARKKVFASRFVELKRALPDDQRITDILNRNRKRLPEASPEDVLRDRWTKLGTKAVINGELTRFLNEKDDTRKKTVVSVLRDPEGIGSDVWAELKHKGTKGSLAKVADAIRIHCRDILKQGKMP